MKRSIKVVFSTNVLFLALSTATSLLGAWALGADGRGEFAIITMWLFVFALIGTLGLPYAHRYWVARRPDLNSEIFSNTVIYSLIASVVIFIIGWMVIPTLISGQDPGTVRLARIFLLNIPVILFSEMLRGQLEGAKLFGWLGIARLTFIATQAASYTALYALGRLTLINALLVVVCAQLICLGLMLFGVLYNLRPRWSPSINVLTKELNYGLRGYFGIVTEFAVWRLDQLMLTALATSTIVGLYAVAVAVAEITATLAASISDALVPEVAAAKDANGSILLLAKSLRLTVYAHIAVLVPLWFAAPYALRFAFGESFVPAAGAMRLLLLASILWSAGLILISGLNGFDSPGLSTIARICSAATTVVMLFILLPRWGMIGAAVSSISGYGVMFIVALVCLLKKRHVGLWEFLRPRRSDISVRQVRSMLRFSEVAKLNGPVKPRTGII